MVSMVEADSIEPLVKMLQQNFKGLDFGKKMEARSGEYKPSAVSEESKEETP